TGSRPTVENPCNRDGLVSVYPAPQYQSHIVGNLAAQSRSDPVQQLLDPNTLQQTVGSHYRPNIILYSENVLRSWGESVSAECCETTFIEDRSPTKDSLEYPDSKFIDLSADDIKIHTLSYDVEEDEDFQELEVRYCMLPDRRGMGGALFQMVWEGHDAHFEDWCGPDPARHLSTLSVRTLSCGVCQSALGAGILGEQIEQLSPSKPALPRGV
uniref:Uncharacterized protein n=1 Tax=Terrapene triunguis TaxID=2587831 RepID=A0A674J4U5_9SAUR